MKKKFVLILGLVCAIFSMTGCGIKSISNNSSKVDDSSSSSKKKEKTTTDSAKKLVCTQTASGVDITFNIGFKDNEIYTMDFDYDMDLSDYSDTQIAEIEKQDFCSSVKTAMSTYENAFTDCSQDISDKHLNVHSILDIDKIAKSVIDKMTSPEDTKEELELEGYECTIK